MNSHTKDSNKNDEKIAELEMQLHKARNTILNLAASQTQCLELYDFRKCNSHEESYAWKVGVFDKIIEIAKPITDKNVYGQLIHYSRAICPLCGDEPQSEVGYTIPEGLTRHLEGFGNMYQCRVMKEIFALANQSWNKNFKDKEWDNFLKESIKKREIENQRMATETLYKKAPITGVTPDLFNGDIDWTENRLKTLGFVVNLNKNVKTFAKEYEAFSVFADITHHNGIAFNVFKKPLPRIIKNGLIWKSKQHICNFVIYDHWKHNLNDKFESRVDGIAQKILSDVNTR